jgi:hypothetical protein
MERRRIMSETDVKPDGAGNPEPEPEPKTELPEQAAGAHVRLGDAVAVVDNFFARHPELDRNLLPDLTGALSVLERLT